MKCGDVNNEETEKFHSWSSHPSILFVNILSNNYSNVAGTSWVYYVKEVTHNHPMDNHHLLLHDVIRFWTPWLLTWTKVY